MKVKPWSAARIVVAMQERYKAPEFALFTNVRNRTGYSYGGRDRYADAVAMSLWPSRGLEVHGFEFKSSRSDWLSEKANPAKAEAIQQYCDRWWLVVGGEGIVQPGELPATWGLLAPRGEKLVAVTEAPKLEPQPLTRQFIAAILRRAHEQAASPTENPVEFERGRAFGKKEAETDLGQMKLMTKRAENERDSARRALAEFEAKSGVAVAEWNAGRVGDAVRALMSLDDNGFRLRQTLDGMKKLAEIFSESAAKIEEVTGRQGR